VAVIVSPRQPSTPETPAPDGGSPRSARSGCRHGSLPRAHRLGWQGSNGSKLTIKNHRRPPADTCFRACRASRLPPPEPHSSAGSGNRLTSGWASARRPAIRGTRELGIRGSRMVGQRRMSASAGSMMCSASQ
jgi:hypothetical protein